MMRRNHVTQQSTEEVPARPEESCVMRCTGTQGPVDVGVTVTATERARVVGYFSVAVIKPMPKAACRKRICFGFQF